MINSPQRWLVLIPLALTTSRVVLAGVVLAVANDSQDGMTFVACLTTAILSDIFDGILARRLGVSSPGLRRYDSAADVAFYLAVLWATWTVHPEVVRDYAWGIALLIVLEVACQVVSLVRSGRPPATHAYSAKVWGICLFAAFVAVLGFGAAKGWMELMIAVGCLADLEVIAIMLLAPAPAVDVLTIIHAVRLRRRAGGPWV